MLGSKFWALGGLNQNGRKQFCSFCHGELMAKKWLDSIEKQKRRSNVCDKQTDRRTDRQSQRQKIIDSWLGAEMNIKQQQAQLANSNNS